MHIGIDASNIRRGGGITHLACLLSEAQPERDGFERITLWGTQPLLDQTPDHAWLHKKKIVGGGPALIARLIWQQAILPLSLKELRVDVLFSPGGTLPWGAGVPTITISQNLLPFDKQACALYPLLNGRRLKMALLRHAQARSFAAADGVIFLTEHSRTAIQGALRRLPRRSTIVAHGIEDRFRMPPRPAQPPKSYSAANPFRLLYVSIIDMYKHQNEVAEAVAMAQASGLPVSIDFVGPDYPLALKRLRAVCRKLDPEGQFLHYKGAIGFDQLHPIYRDADAFVFASSCENLPNILIEAMAAGLPIASSSNGPMPEVLGDAGLYFNARNPADICETIARLFGDPQLRGQLAQAAWQRAQAYSWARCARETFAFIRSVATRSPG